MFLPSFSRFESLLHLAIKPSPDQITHITSLTNLLASNNASEVFTEAAAAPVNENPRITTLVTNLEIMEREREKDKADKDVFKDIKDGAVFKSVDYFRRNSDALVCLMYSDTVELTSRQAAIASLVKTRQIPSLYPSCGPTCWSAGGRTAP